jgi:predicted ATPase
MDFLKDLVQIQQTVILEKLSDHLLNNQTDKKEFIVKYNKPNYQLIKVSNTKMVIRKRIKIDDMIDEL